MILYYFIFVQSIIMVDAMVGCKFPGVSLCDTLPLD